MTSICPTCLMSFEGKRRDSKFCSRLCYRRNPSVATEYSRRTSEYQKSHSREFSRRFKKLKYKCSHEKIIFSLEFSSYQSLVSLGCHYCNKDLLRETGCSLDRIEPKLGYVVQNIVPCCGACNQIRNVHLTYDEMKVAMKAITEHRKTKL